MGYVFREGEIVENWIWLGGRALAIIRFLIGFMALLPRFFKKTGAFFYRHRNRFTMDSLEKGLIAIWVHVVKYKASFMFFGVIVLIGLTLLTWFLLSWQDWGKMVKMIGSVAVPILGCIVSLFMIYRLFRQFENQSKQMEMQAKQLERQTENTQKQMAAEQFKNAVDHLGSEKQAVVLGGVHALHNLAVNFPNDYSKQVFEVLCSFIREETRKEEYKTKVLAEIESTDKTKATSSETPTTWLVLPNMPSLVSQMGSTKHATSLIVIQTIVDKLFREKIELDEIDKATGKKRLLYRKNVVNLSGAFLRGVNLTDANLQEADLRKANLQEANLFRVDLQEAELLYANLQGAEFGRANLQRANLRDANLQGANLMYANLMFVTLWRANLQGVELYDANLQSAILSEANLQGVNYSDAKLSHATLVEANLQGAMLWQANLELAFLSKANLQGAYLGRANLYGAYLDSANLQGAFLGSANLQWAKLENANLRGIRCNDKDHRETIKDAIKNNTGLKTDLSGITLYDNKNKLDLDEDGKKAWFRKQGANVDDLTADEVQEIFKDW